MPKFWQNLSFTIYLINEKKINLINYTYLLIIFFSFITGYVFSTDYNEYLDNMAKNQGFKTWKELSNTAIKCRSIMLDDFSYEFSNCSLSDRDCMLNHATKQRKLFSENYSKVLSSNAWKTNKCQTWMLGGSSDNDDKDDRIEELEDRIDELESELDSIRN